MNLFFITAITSSSLRPSPRSTDKPLESAKAADDILPSLFQNISAISGGYTALYNFSVFLNVSSIKLPYPPVNSFIIYSNVFIQFFSVKLHNKHFRLFKSCYFNLHMIPSGIIVL